MKSYLFIISILTSILLCNCNKEDDITAEIVPYKREHMYDTNSSDPVLKFVSQYYYRYGHFFITDPDSSDYIFNFGTILSGTKDQVDFVYPTQEQEHLMKGVQMVKTLLLDSYNQEFIKKHFPYSIILADNITDIAWEETTDYYLGIYYCIFRIQDTENMEPEGKNYIAAKLNENIWSYMATNENVPSLPAGFYQFGEGLYGTFGGMISEDAMYGKGFTGSTLPGELEDFILRYPTKGQDIGKWIKFLILTPDEEIERLVNKYEAMRVKYNLLTKALKEMGIDYKKLRYTEK
ncbi:hypothetical protein AALK14_11735 [Butyricimonas hominis]|uniref:hypothetical protein n=1 Tax=Butyricimonas TaxID=574697 RepID=UPI003516E2F4